MALTGVDTANLDSYNEAVTQEPRIKILRDKMSIEFKPNWQHSVAEMAIQLDDGTTLEATHDSGIPWSDVAEQRQALETKFENSRGRRRRASKPHPEERPAGPRLEGWEPLVMLPPFETALRASSR